MSPATIGALVSLVSITWTPVLVAQSRMPPPPVPAQEALRMGVGSIEREPTARADAPDRPVAPSTARPIDPEDDTVTRIRHRFALLGGIAGAAAGVVVATRHDDDLGEASFLAPFVWSGYAFIGATFGVAVGTGVSIIVHPPRRTDRPML